MGETKKKQCTKKISMMMNVCNFTDGKIKYLYSDGEIKKINQRKSNMIIDVCNFINDKIKYLYSDW